MTSFSFRISCWKVDGREFQSWTIWQALTNQIIVEHPSENPTIKNRQMEIVGKKLSVFQAATFAAPPHESPTRSGRWCGFAHSRVPDTRHGLLPARVPSGIRV